MTRKGNAGTRRCPRKNAKGTNCRKDPSRKFCAEHQMECKTHLGMIHLKTEECPTCKKTRLKAEQEAAEREKRIKQQKEQQAQKRQQEKKQTAGKAKWQAEKDDEIDAI